MICMELLFTTMIAIVHSTEAQLSMNEVLKNVTKCNWNANISLDCGTNALIAVHSIQFAYNASCETKCCPYSNNDCFVHAEANDIKELGRICSGRKSCTMSISTEITDFTTCSLGVKHISYMFLQYYCIEEARIQSVCSSAQLHSSANNPLYLTNEGYPEVTTGTMSCSCSVELFSCISNINLYINDADLYSDTNNCEQIIKFSDPDNRTVTTIGCEDHYGNHIEKILLDSHYVKIDFNSNSIQNQEGYFFVGFDSTVSDVSFKLTCSSQPETWCAGCGTVPTITNGNVTLLREDGDSFEATANVTCDSGYETGTPIITCQANGTWPNPECTKKQCGPVPTITNGKVTLNKEDNDSFGATANVICDSGYETGTPVITCKANGTWPKPECMKKRCGNSFTIANGNVTLNVESDDSFGATANVTCDSGYETGTTIITCQANGTWPTPQCTRKRCGTVSTIANGNVTLNEENDDSFGATANVTCDSGYETGTPIITCQVNGTWLLSECTRKRCGTTSTIANGNVKLNEENDDSFGATANVTCYSGYETSTPIITCQASGTWPKPECRTKRCGTVSTIANGNVTLNKKNDDSFGATANVTCDSGYEADTPIITCQASGIWPKPECTKKRCGTVSTIANGNVTLNEENDDSFGATANVTCDSGYETGTPIITCQANGTWLLSECTRKRCGTTSTIANGNVKHNEENDDSFGATANVTCDSGYETSTPIITCQASGTWPKPECRKKRCGTVSTVANGTVTLNQENDDSFGATANVTCESGYETGTPIITCQASGIWPKPECTKKRCGTVSTIANGNVTLNEENDDSFGATANVTCDSGYETGTPIITCQANGTWPKAACTRKRCGTTSTIANGNVKLNVENDGSFGATANVTCDSGYETRTPIITCQADGTWPKPECRTKRCGTVSTIANGTITLNEENDDSFGATANVTCDSGYETDTPIITCQANGIWPKPDCAKKRCGTVFTIANGTVTLNEENDYSFGATANVTCDSGYETDTPILICQASGTWPKPECTIKRCGTALKIAYGNVTLNEESDDSFGATANITCESGYETRTSKITCQANGTWLTSECTRKSCGTVFTIANGFVTLNEENDDSFGATAIVTCDSGYKTGTPSITCQASGAWPKPECIRKTKPVPTLEKDSEGNNTTIIIVVLVVLFIFLAQLFIMCYLQCKIHSIRMTATDGDTEIHKRILMTVLGSIPVIGIIPIYLTWKVFYRDVYRVSHNKKGDIKMYNKNGVLNTEYDFHEIIKNTEASEHKSAFPDNQTLETDLSGILLTHKMSEETLNIENDKESDVIKPEHKYSDAKENVPDSESTPNANPTTIPDTNPTTIPDTNPTTTLDTNPAITTDTNSTITPDTDRTTIIASKPIVYESRQHDDHIGGTMTRGLSAAIFPDQKNDMALEATPRPYFLKHKHHKHPVEINNDAHKHHHFSESVEKKRTELKPVMEEARKQGHHVNLVQDKLYIGNALYHVEGVTHQTNAHHKPMHDTDGHHKRKHDTIVHHKHTHGREGHHKRTQDT